MTEGKLDIGDLVKFKVGGPVMEVTYLNKNKKGEDEVLLIYFCKADNEFKTIGGPNDERIFNLVDGDPLPNVPERPTGGSSVSRS